MKIRPIISEVMAAFSALLALGCAKASSDPADAIVGTRLVVLGAAVDKESGQSVPGIEVLLQGYVRDSKVENGLVVSDTTHTGQDGRFRFESRFDDGLDWSLRAVDVDGPENGGPYQPSRIDFALGADSPSYDPGTETFFLDGNLFYLQTDAG